MQIDIYIEKKLLEVRRGETTRNNKTCKLAGAIPSTYYPKRYHIIIIMITPLGPWAVRSIYLSYMFFFTGFGFAGIPEAQGTSR